MQKKERTRSVLIIADSLKEIEHIKKEFIGLKAPITIEIARSGEDALSMLTRSGAKLPDVILLDVQMPKMSGFEFLRIIRSYHSFLKIKVYLMNSSLDEYDNIQSKKLGVKGHLSKPFDLTGRGAKEGNKLKKDLGF